jgi:uncharacterized protein YjbI with pentapeptide repeats
MASSTDTKNSKEQTDTKNSNGSTETDTSVEQVKFNEKPCIVLMDVFFVPLLVFLAGAAFTLGQFLITNVRQDIDNADKTRETKEKVLADYSRAMTELLVTKNNLGAGEEGFFINQDQANIARVETLIALRRLKPDESSDESKSDQSKSDESKSDQSKSDLDKLKWLKDPLTNWGLLNPVEQSKIDRGELKGLLVRYLYDTQLIGCFIKRVDGKIEPREPMVHLWGADLESVVLKNAWLPNIRLELAELNKAEFVDANLYRANLIEAKLIGAKFIKTDLRSADLRGADLSGAKLDSADLSSADLRFANLKTAILSNTKLKGACYIKGTEAEYLSDGFNPEQAGMVAMTKEESNPGEKDTYKPCPPPLAQ